MAWLDGACILLLAMRSQVHGRTTAFRERCHLGSILQQLLYLTATAAKVICVFDIMDRRRMAYGACPFPKIPRDTLYSISPAREGWYEWVVVVYISFQATILQESL